jgi:DNA-binding NarL/FixJ family response regulator
MNADLVPVDNMAAVEALAPEARELAVTTMLTEARSWLAHAVEASEPKQIAEFKAQMATVAEATKQLGLSKEIQMDAQEMVRRAETGLGQSIRKGQAEGTVNTKADGGHPAHRDVLNTDHNKYSPSDFLAAGTTTVETYAMADASEEEFEAAIDEAKSEGNLSRANVVRKIKGASNLTGEKRLQKIRKLAQRGMTSRQIGQEIGQRHQYVRELAHDAKIDIPADRMVGKSSRRVKHGRIAQQTVSALEGMAMGLEMFDPDELEDRQYVADWVISLGNSLRVLNRFHKQLKEMTQ